MNHKIFNERPECQDRLISFLQKMGYTYVSRSEAEQKRGSLSKVIFTDELIRFLSKQTYKYKGYEFLFSGDSVQRAVNALDASLLQGLSMASKEIYNLLTLGISLEENVILDKDVPVRQSFDLSYIDFEHPANNVWQVTEEFSVERPNGQYARPDVVLMVNGIPLVVIECKKSSVDVKEGVLQNVRNMGPDYIPHLFKYTQLVMAMNPNKVYSRENLLNIVWGYEYPGDVRTVDVHIRRLREKIEKNPSEPKYVHTKWGVGYYFQA
mgnify:CR=1 FL=1